MGGFAQVRSMDYLFDFAAEVKRSKKRLGFFGLGETNIALMRELVALGCRDFYLRDERLSPPLPEDIPFARLFFGKDAFTPAEDEIIFLSPSVRRERAEVRHLTSLGSTLSSDLDLFAGYLDNSTVTPKLGVTGSDGKSTTTELTYRILASLGLDAPAIGNIGVPFCKRRQGGFVAELSSFQLSYTSPRLDAAALTSITPNHLNWHSSIEEYYAAKTAIFRHADRAVIPSELRSLYRELSRRMPVSLVSVNESFAELSALAPSDCIFTLGGDCLMRGGRPFISVADLCVRERHNLFNMLTAAALVGDLADDTAIRAALSGFSGLPHRCERFLSVGGVTFIDSSIDTTPSRTLSTLSSMPRGVRVILGGSGKGVSYAPLADALASLAGRVSVYGRDREIIAEEISQKLLKSGVPLSVSEGFSEAVDLLLRDLNAGETVLLSPSATAYGEFRDYRERGDKFKDIILSRYGKKE